MWPALAAALLVGSGAAAPAPQASRIVFASSRTTVAQLYSVEPSGRGLAQLTFGPGDWASPLPSPDGRFVAALQGSPVLQDKLWVMRPDGSDARLLADHVWWPSWSANSRRLVFEQDGAIWTMTAASGAEQQVTDGSAPTLSPDGRSIAFVRQSVTGTVLAVRRHSRERILVHVVSAPPAWSPDGEWIAITAGANHDLELVRPSGGAPRILVRGCGFCTSYGLVWSPDSRRLAYVDEEGVHVVLRSGQDSQLLDTVYPHGIAWSPSGKAIVFATTSAIEIATLGGQVRRLVSFGPDEYQPGAGWSRAAPGLAYQPPEETPLLVRVSPRELEARVPIRQLSADGDRVAYWLCPDILGAWRPGDEQPVPLGPTTLAACRSQNASSGFGTYVGHLALAGDRLAYVTGAAGASRGPALMLTTLDRGDDGVQIALGAHAYGQRQTLDDLVGGGTTLVYGARESLVTSPQGPETISRIDGSTPAQITHAPDDLQPLAVDQGRIVARLPDGSLELLDVEGGVLRTFDVGALAAVLAGDDLVVLVQGELRDYSASTGALLHVWPMPDVPSSNPCRGYNYACPGIRLTLGDAARGVVVYMLDDAVHLLRLSDGEDKTVPSAIVAELTDAGLFYAYVGDEPWPGRIRFVPFDELPL